MSLPFHQPSLLTFKSHEAPGVAHDQEDKSYPLHVTESFLASFIKVEDRIILD